MHSLIDYVCEEMEELESKADKGKLSMAEMQYLDTLAHTKKNLLKADEMMGESEYSMNDGYRNKYRNRSYENRSMARKRDARGRYSRGSSEMVEELRELMEDAPDERTRNEFQRFIQKIEQM